MRIPYLIASLLIVLPATAQAVLWNIDFGSTQTTFVADPGGGPISNISATLGGVTYDAPVSGVNTPVYDPLTNTIQGQGTFFGFVLNSQGSGGCNPSECVLLFQESGNVWNTLTVFQSTLLQAGTYNVSSTTSVPEPPMAVLMMGALAVLLGFRRRWGASS